MHPSRTATQSISRILRITRPHSFRNTRFQSTQSSSVSQGTSPAILGGIAGGTVTSIIFYAWYHFSGAKTLVKTANETKSYIQAAQNRLVENTPAPNEALRWLRETSTQYAAFVPGARGYVDKMFDDLDKVHDKHREEVDQIVSDAYNELKQLSGRDVSLDTAAQAWAVLQKHGKRITALAGDVAQDILDNHPELKKKVGGNMDQLRQMGERYGPEAKKQVDQTWDQVKDITKNGINTDSAERVYKLVQEKMEVVRKLGDDAWKQSLEKVKPYLERNPQVKELVEGNASALKQSNFSQLYERVKNAVESGNTEDLEKYVKDTADKVKQSGAGGFDQLLKSIPGGDQMLPKLQSLQQVAEKHGGEAKKLLEETVHDVTQLLSKKADQAKDLAKDAEKSAK